jgi:hypothetical protein
VKTIKDAMENAFADTAFDNLQLITDGGPENDNITLKEFVQNVNIWHTIALKDIEQSNSMMEAFYHTIKYRYLYLMSIHNTEELITEFKNLLHEYHFHKPHYALGIFTPDEVRNGADVSTSYRDIYTQAARERREINRNVHCTQKCS